MVLQELWYAWLVGFKKKRKRSHLGCTTGVSDVNLQNNAGYTAVMLASLTAPDVPGGMEVVRKLMELSNINIRSSKVTWPVDNY